MKPRNPLLQKRALDALLEGMNDPEYATHQHHSDPDFSTQNGKDYAGRNTTEPESGALKDGIPASLLSVELGKRADIHPMLRPTKSYNPTGDTPTTSDDYESCISCGEVFMVDPRMKSDRCSECRRKEKSADVDNPNVTTIPSAPTDVDPSTATFFKESDKMSPAEEKIMSVVAPQGFSYGAHVTDGTTLFFRGASERLSFDPKTGLVTYLKNGKVALECPVNQLAQNVHKMASHTRFHETLKAAIRPSPSKVFEQKVDKATGQQPPAPKNPDDSDVDEAKQTLENAGYGDMTGNQIGMNAASKWGDKIKKMEARRGESVETTLKTAEEHGNAPDTGKYDSEHEAHVREEAKGWAQYAEEADNTEEIKSYDPSGNYLCGTCDMRRGTNECARVDGEISFTTGSCRLFHLGDPETDPPMKNKFSKEDAKYAERPNEKGFGCKRCEYGSEAKKADSEGRESWCSFWGMHVVPTACCAENEGDDDKTLVKASSIKAAEGDHHHERIECKNCHNVQTCRCSAKKATTYVDSCSNCTKAAAITKSYGTGTPSGGTPNDPTEDVQDEEDAKVSSAKTAEIGIHETPTMLPPRDDIRRHLDEDVQDEVMEGVMDGVKDAKVADAIEGEVLPRRTGNWKLYVFEPDGKTEIARYYVGDKKVGVERVNEMYGPLTHEQENQLYRVGSLNLSEVVIKITNWEYPKKGAVSEYELDRDEEAAQYLDAIGDMKNEAKAAFMEDPSMQQYAVDVELTLEELWKEMGEEFTENYFASSYAKQGSIETEEGLICPNCKSTKGKAVRDDEAEGPSLQECLTCGSFYQLRHS
jgi:hypothetical protein